MRATIVLVIGALGLVVSVGCSDNGSDAGPTTTRSDTASTSTAPECVAGGEAATVVPDVMGETLRDAIDMVEEAGLNVVEDGVPNGDPVGDAATVRAQEPPAGTRVPLGACVGFRTEA